jgi:hypothetical protein
MNMQASIKLASALLVLFACTVLISCKKEPEAKFVVNDVELYPNSAGKTKVKSNQQYVAILHANLFQTALSANDIFEIDNCIESIGDKELAREVIISNFMNDEGVVIPSMEVMNTDMDAFITETYIRFLVRFPTEAEKAYLRNFIITNPYVTPEIVYFSFALSNEYMFY